MKNEKEINREVIHRLLDGNLGPTEQQALSDQVRSNPALQQEFDSLERTIRSVEMSERVPAPPFFTAEVMRRLPARKSTIGSRVKDFFLKGRVLKWNMATALAVAALFALLSVHVLRQRSVIVETAGIPQQEQLVTVTMKLEAPEAHHVAVAGTFNKWKADAHVLTRQQDGIWTISIPLRPGEYHYMFVVDGKAWVTDPNAESYNDDGFGNKNAVVRVKI